MLSRFYHGIGHHIFYTFLQRSFSVLGFWSSTSTCEDSGRMAVTAIFSSSYFPFQDHVNNLVFVGSTHNLFVVIFQSITRYVEFLKLEMQVCQLWLNPCTFRNDIMKVHIHFNSFLTSSTSASSPTVCAESLVYSPHSLLKSTFHIFYIGLTACRSSS